MKYEDFHCDSTKSILFGPVHSRQLPRRTGARHLHQPNLQVVVCPPNLCWNIYLAEADIMTYPESSITVTERMGVMR